MSRPDNAQETGNSNGVRTTPGLCHATLEELGCLWGCLLEYGHDGGHHFGGPEGVLRVVHEPEVGP